MMVQTAGSSNSAAVATPLINPSIMSPKTEAQASTEASVSLASSAGTETLSTLEVRTVAAAPLAVPAATAAPVAAPTAAAAPLAAPAATASASYAATQHATLSPGTSYASQVRWLHNQFDDERPEVEVEESDPMLNPDLPLRENTRI